MGMADSMSPSDAGMTPRFLTTPFVAPADLAALQASSIRVIDIRPREAFTAGHVPGAASSPYTMGWRVREGGAPGLLPPADRLAALINATGLTPERRAVIVASGATASDLAGAARVYWTLKTAGHGPVSILAGGFEASARQGFPVSAGEATPVAAARYPLRLTDAYRSDLAATAAALARGDHALIDAREPAQFRGAAQSPEVQAAGHLPGAASMPYTLLFDPATGMTRPHDELAALLAAPAGEPDGRPALVYCNTGHTAALVWFALSELLGREARLFDGSMAEWTADRARPVVTLA
jgi:thiosulfate/3-mercaptopyruvate sulfurtransferase